MQPPADLRVFSIGGGSGTGKTGAALALGRRLGISVLMADDVATGRPLWACTPCPHGRGRASATAYCPRSHEGIASARVARPPSAMAALPPPACRLRLPVCATMRPV
jgi:hypothetical protein